MSDVFISYSRKNSDFVHKLNDALAADGRDVWADWQDIARGEDWWRSIQVGIDSADTTLVVVTEHWLLSEICQRELDYVRQQNKRVFPIIRQKIEGDVALRVKGTWVDQEWEQRARDNWKYLRSLNWLFFDDDTTFDTVFRDLLTALDTDQAYVKSHTRYLVRALEWQQSQRNPSFLLEGDQLAAAKAWLDSSVGKHPEPHPSHHEYMTASSFAAAARDAREKAREQLIRQSRRATIGLGIGVVVAIIAAVVVGQQFISARAEVTRAAATLQQVNLQVTSAINQQTTAEALVSTATVEQGRAVEAQQTSAVREQSASTQVAVAGATLSPVPPTLTAVAEAITFAQTQQELAAQLSFASIQLVDNDPQSALAIVDDMVNTYPDEALAYMGRGLILDTTGSQDAAIADYTRAIELNPEYLDAYNNRGSIYASQEKYEEALADFNSTIALDPIYDLGYHNRGTVYFQSGNVDEAIRDFNRAIELNADYVPNYIGRGMAYTSNEDYDAAIADFTKAVELDPTSESAFIERGIAYYDQEDYEAAIADYEHVMELNPENEEAFYNRGMSLYELGDYEAALDDFTEAIALNAEDIYNYIERGRTFEMLLDLESASADYSSAIELDPEFAFPYLKRANIYAQQDDMDAALTDYWQWVQLNQSSTQTGDMLTGDTPIEVTVSMTEGLVYSLPFQAAAGQTLTASAIADNTDSLDPLLVLLDPQGEPLTFGDNTDESVNAAISGYTLPTGGTYTLLVTHASSGGEGDIEVTLDLSAAAAP